MKRIIIEGIDGSGKSTLIEGLRQEFHFLTPVVNAKRSEQNFDIWWPETLATIYGHGELVPIHDRFYYSELVYGPVLRGSTLGSKATHQRVRRELRQQAFLVYMRPSMAAIIKDSQTNEQMNGVLTHLPELLEKYDSLMKMQPLYYGDRFMTYDWHFKADFNNLVERLERYLLVA